MEDQQQRSPCVQPLVEMSQDCIVEWNESQNNGDLQELATTTTPVSHSSSNSPFLSNSGNGRRRHRSSSSSWSQSKPQRQFLKNQELPHLSSIGLEEVRRRLEQQHPAQSSIRTANGKKEEEIEAIFQILEQEDEGLDGISPSEAPTQPRKNNLLPRRLQDSSALAATGVDDSGLRHRSTTSSLASRRRRRPKDPTVTTAPNLGAGSLVRNHHAQKKKRLRISSMSIDDQHQDGSTPLPTIDESSAPSSSSRAEEGAFDSLLKQMSTQQSPKGSRSTTNKENQVPPQGIDLHGGATSHSVRKALLPKPTKQIEAHKEPQTSSSSAVLPSLRRSSTEIGSKCEETRVPVASECTTVSDGADEPKVENKIAPILKQAFPQNEEEEVEIHIRQAMNSEALPICGHATLVEAQHQDEFSSTKVVPSKPSAGPSNISGSTKPASGKTENDEDEFGAFDFSDADMACLDSLLAAKSSQHVISSGSPPISNTYVQSNNLGQEHAKHTLRESTNSNPQHTLGDQPLVNANASDLQREQNNKNSTPGLIRAKTSETHEQARGRRKTQGQGPSSSYETKEAIIVDEFGEFPDFDFDVIDQAIAERQESLSQPQTNRRETMSSPLTIEIVKNPRTLTSDPNGLSFIKFSRYKILSIDDDSRHFRKTLSLAVWKEEMLQDEEEEVKIHHNCSVEIHRNGLGYDIGGGIDSLKRDLNYPDCGAIQLRGQWYYTMVAPGDVVHVCSLTGRFRTDCTALPIILHSHPPDGSEVDDLVLIHHPDLLLSPTIVSETVTCPRRAVLKSRNGSSGLTNKSALIGTLRHALFGLCIKEKNLDRKFVLRNVKKIVRENSEALLGCGTTTAEAEKLVAETLPVIINFVSEHMTFGPSKKSTSALPAAYVQGHIGVNKGIRFAAHSTYSVEEPVVSPELALKGFVDAVLETSTSPINNENTRAQNHTIAGLKHSLMALELKTGHNQTSQHTHMGQLSLYTLMLQGRYGVKLTPHNLFTSRSTHHQKPDPEGAASGGMLLYLNHQSSKATHVAPESHEFKTLIAQRNIVASELDRASKPRGIKLCYEEETKAESRNGEGFGKRIILLPATPAELPQVQPSQRMCNRCYENRSCMLYAASQVDVDDWAGLKQTHGGLLAKYTGKLRSGDFEYFRKWDRLIDLEAHSSVGSISTAWLVDSYHREKKTGESISCLVYSGVIPRQKDGGILLRFQRSSASTSQSPLETLALSKGCQVVISTDGSSFHDSQTDPKFEYQNTQLERKKFRHRMNVIRGYLECFDGDSVLIAAKRDDLDRIRGMVFRYKKLSEDDVFTELLFRIDKDNGAIGIGILRQNLINFFTGDFSRDDKEQPSPIEIAKQRRLPRLRDFIVRMTKPSFHEDTYDSFRQINGPAIPGCSTRALQEEYQNLNQDQQNAVQKVLQAKDYALIQGLPGTGKTSTLAFIARLLAAQGKRVLITSYTNSAVDNVALKLVEKGVGDVDEETGLCAMVRVGSKQSCHQNVCPWHTHDIATRVEKLRLGESDQCLSPSRPDSLLSPPAEILSLVVSTARIVFSTVLTVPRSPLLANEVFDVVIVDEAGQTSQPAILGALISADAFVLVGDHQQLPPLVSSEIAQAGGYGESMLMRLAQKHPESVAALTYQYRMNESICKLSSYLIYGGKLKCGNTEVARQKLQLDAFPSNLPPTSSTRKGYWPWLKMTIDPDKAVVFVDTDNVKRSPRSSTQQQTERTGVEWLEEKSGGRTGGNVQNLTEALLVRYIVTGLISSGVSARSIGIISPFRAQTRILEGDPTLANWKKNGLEISTIDRYQGRDKPVVILSFVRSNSGGKVGRLLQDKRRLNVALTRAKVKLIMLGSFSTLKNGSPPLRPMLGRINTNGCRQLLPDNALECYDIT